MQRFSSLGFVGMRARIVTSAALLAAVFVAGAVAGGTSSTSPLAPAPVYAACHAPNITCSSPGINKSAYIDAAYIIPGGSSVTPVEPSAATTWALTATYSPYPLNCISVPYYSAVDVSWNGTNWVTGGFTPGGPFVSVRACNLVSCGSHASAYRLDVELKDTYLGNNLDNVVFTTTYVPNGTDFDASTCALGSTRTPSGAPFAATDSGPFECGTGCGNSGATVNLIYQ